MDGWIFPAVAFFLLALAFCLWSGVQTGKYKRARRERNEARFQRDTLIGENAALCETAEKDVVLYQRSMDENTHLLAQNADLREALQEARKPKTRAKKEKAQP